MLDCRLKAPVEDNKSLSASSRSQKKRLPLKKKVRPNSLSTKLPHSLRRERKKCSQWCDYFWKLKAQNCECPIQLRELNVCTSHLLYSLCTHEHVPPLWYKQEGFAAQPHFPVAMLSYAAPRPKSVSCLENLSKAKTLDPRDWRHDRKDCMLQPVSVITWGL